MAVLLRNARPAQKADGTGSSQKSRGRGKSGINRHSPDERSPKRGRGIWISDENLERGESRTAEAEPAPIIKGARHEFPHIH
jgi:hypothetical protein